MPGPKQLAINLNDVKRQGLELLVRRYTTGQQKVIRARIVLLAAMGKNNREIANELDVSLDTARLWRQRWLDLQSISLDDLSVEERLDDQPRPGAPPRLTANQIFRSNSWLVRNLKNRAVQLADGQVVRLPLK